MFLQNCATITTVDFGTCSSSPEETLNPLLSPCHPLVPLALGNTHPCSVSAGSGFAERRVLEVLPWRGVCQSFALSWLSDAPSCGWTTFSLSALPSVGIQEASIFGLSNDAAVLGYKLLGGHMYLGPVPRRGCRVRK